MGGAFEIDIVFKSQGCTGKRGQKVGHGGKKEMLDYRLDRSQDQKEEADLATRKVNKYKKVKLHPLLSFSLTAYSNLLNGYLPRHKLHIHQESIAQSKSGTVSRDINIYSRRR